MGEIKSAAEIAREKIEKLGGVTEEERLKWKYVPEGEKLAARYIKEDYNLVTELDEYEEKARKHVIDGSTDIFIRNISLPMNEMARRNTKKAMEGLKTVKSDKVAVENVFSKIRHVLEHYVQQGEQQKKQAYESLKAEFEARIQQAIKQQTGVNAAQMKIDVERQPQFQEEWQKLQAQMESQYTQLLDEYKQELSAIA
jgi:flagellar biosynthesis component FlhA